MKNTVNWRWLVLFFVFLSFSFWAGWQTNIKFNRGEEAMGQFMTDFSALSYLQKGDTQSATLILRSSAERSLITAHTYGTPTLDSFRRDASSRWFAEYAKLRKKLPPASRGPENEEFDREVDDILAEATKDISMRNNSVKRTP